MSEKKRSRRRKEGYTDPGDLDTEKPSKEEYKVAKWMKANLKTKKTKFLSHNVEYFTANKAIDALMKSKFGSGDEPKFPSRDHIIEFLDIMLEHKFFHRAKKVPVSMEELRGSRTKSKDEKDKNGEKGKDSKDKLSKEKQQEKDFANGDGTKATDADENSHAEGVGPIATTATTTTEDNNQQLKRKKKIRLDMHPEQVFVDGSEAYVWIYDPIPLHYWIYGFILVLGAIGICLFPLWPPTIRKGVYYLSVAAAGFLVFILALTVVRLIVFTLIWIVTAAKVHFWIFPNLTEDVGFFASFWPLYESKYISDAEKTSKSDKKSKSKSKKAKEKDSDAEDTATDAVTGGQSIPPLEPEKIEQIKENPDVDAELLRKRKIAASVEATTNSSGADNSDTQQDGSGSTGGDSDAKCSQTPSESESEISGRDYEIINPSEVQNVQ